MENNQREQVNNNQQRTQGSQMPEYQRNLKYAYELFLEGQKHYKAFSLESSLNCFSKAQSIIKVEYPKITDEKYKTITDSFIKKLDFANNAALNQYDKRFEIKATAGFASASNNPNNLYTKEELANILNDNQPNYQVSTKDTSQIISNQNNNKGNQGQGNQESKKEEDKKIVGNDLKDKICSEIIDTKPGVSFEEVIGLAAAKQILKEIIIIPNKRPDLFVGLRSPPRGLLLFGPPGTGKTMIAKAVATECECTFFNISSATLTSKYVGESEKLVRALFELAFEKQPSVVFIDEIESILSKRTENENEAMKRLKTEFLIQFDGVGSNLSARVLIIGATNRPQDLDPAVLRRLPKRIYLGPFDEDDKVKFISTIIKQNNSNITAGEFKQISSMCTNYSNSDLKELCREAAYEPLREVVDINVVKELRSICYGDFLKAIKKVRGTLTPELLKDLLKWNDQFGALS